MDHPQSLFTVILAAGKGTRMKSDKAKVLHEVFFAPMIHHVLTAVQALHATKDIVVIGHQRESVMQALAGYNVEFALQQEQLGTGHAVLCAEKAVTSTDGVVMILCGDTPLIKTETLQFMYQQHCERSSLLTVMTTILSDPTNYGRIIQTDSGKLLAIVEEKDASSEQKKIQEINAGIYCVNSKFLFETIKKIGTDNSQGEVYLTDIVSIAVAADLNVDKFINPTAQDVLGVNSRVELALAHKEIQRRHNNALMLQGVTMHDPETTAIAHSAVVGRDTVLYPGVRISGTSRLGNSCIIQEGCVLHNCTLADHVSIGPHSYLEGSECIEQSSYPPHSVVTP
ncbi:MAG: NTP transferase domain-containing protein [Desulfocapsaceae bacterium]|nr:NTP transferase domain-containing protein [Desulfocapsaceae bacterium]